MESLAELLQLPGWHVENWRREGELAVLQARFTKRPECCPHCQGRAVHSHGWRDRRASHVGIGHMRCDVELHYQRWRCLACAKVFAPAMPGIAPRARLTGKLCDQIRDQIVRMGSTVRKVAQWLQAGWRTVWRCLLHPVRIDEIAKEELAHLCLDEVRYRSPQQFVTVLSCASGRVLGVAKGRGLRPSAALLAALPQQVRADVATLATDFNLGQRRAALEMLPVADICADHFHLVRLISDMQRHCTQQQRLPGRAAARELRGSLHAHDPWQVQRWLDRWQLTTGPLYTLWKTVNAWQFEIENFIQTRRTTGPAEALNRRIGLVRRTAGGYTNLNNFILRIFLLNEASHH
jgi:transposase